MFLKHLLNLKVIFPSYFTIFRILREHQKNSFCFRISHDFILFLFCVAGSIYYAFVKTGSDSCSKEGYPKLSLFGNNQKHTEIDMKSSYRSHSSSTNNNQALQKYQFDIFQWQDDNIGNIERMHLQLHSENKQSKCQWPIQWMFVIHNGYSFTGKTRILSK